jgi:hypothetical protein
VVWLSDRAEAAIIWRMRPASIPCSMARAAHPERNGHARAGWRSIVALLGLAASVECGCGGESCPPDVPDPCTRGPDLCPTGFPCQVFPKQTLTFSLVGLDLGGTHDLLLQYGGSSPGTSPVDAKVSLDGVRADGVEPWWGHGLAVFQWSPFPASPKMLSITYVSNEGFSSIITPTFINELCESIHYAVHPPPVFPL